VRVLGVSIIEGCLTLDVSAEILAYGGNANERALIAQLLETAFGLPRVDTLTLTVEGKLVPLPEGRILNMIKNISGG
jgi:spore germination protein GerM